MPWSRLKSDSALALFAFTVFVSATLMFLVEPMVARMVLPVAGGVADGVEHVRRVLPGDASCGLLVRAVPHR